MGFIYCRLFSWASSSQEEARYHAVRQLSRLQFDFCFVKVWTFYLPARRSCTSSNHLCTHNGWRHQYFFERCGLWNMISWVMHFRSSFLFLSFYLRFKKALSLPLSRYCQKTPSCVSTKNKWNPLHPIMLHSLVVKTVWRSHKGYFGKKCRKVLIRSHGSDIIGWLGFLIPPSLQRNAA